MAKQRSKRTQPRAHTIVLELGGEHSFDVLGINSVVQLLYKTSVKFKRTAEIHEDEHFPSS